MSFPKLVLIALLGTLLMAAVADAGCGLFHRRARQASSCGASYQSETYSATSCQTASYQQQWAPAAVPMVPQLQPAPSSQAVPVPTSQSPPVPPKTTTIYYGDPFLAWLNAHRARYGRGPVAYDAGLMADAAASNAAMRAYGFGHRWDYAPANKNVGMGSPETVMMAWANSPAHNAWLLQATVVGVAFDGQYATFSAR